MLGFQGRGPTLCVSLSTAFVCCPLQFWSHMQLLEFYLRRHGVRPAVLKRGMSSQAKQDALSL